MLISDTLIPPNCVDAKGWVDIAPWTGRSLNTIPKALRDADDDRLTHVDSILYHVADPWCNPCSGGIAGHAHLCNYYGVDAETFRKDIAPRLDWLKWWGSIPVSNVNSVQWDGIQHHGQRNAQRFRNLGLDVTACNGGSLVN